MLKWAIIFFIISVVAGIFGFGGISVAAAGLAKFLFSSSRSRAGLRHAASGDPRRMRKPGRWCRGRLAASPTVGFVAIEAPALWQWSP